MNNLSIQKINLIFIFLIFLFISFQKIQANNFDLMPTNIHYFGAVDGGGEHIIAYGTNGAYLMSTDKGNSWDQYQIDGEFGEIRKIVNYNDVLWGIIKSGIIIKSTDNGFTWDKTDFELEEGDYFINIEVTDNSIYVRTKTKILLFNKELQLNNSFSDERIKISEGSRFSKPEDCPDHYYAFMKYHDNKLFIISNLESNGFFVVSNDLKKADFVDLTESLYFTNPEMYLLYDIMEYKGKSVFNISGNLYYPEDNFLSWKYYYQDTTFMNRNDSLKLKKWPGVNRTSYYFHNNELFINGYESANSFMDFGIKKYHNSPRDTFIKFNNFFDNNYVTGTYYLGVYRKFDGIFQVLKPQYIIDDNIIIRTGNAKSLLISRDNANSWELVSYLNAKPKLILNESNYVFFDPSKDIPDISTSKDGGITFLPTQISDGNNMRDIERIKSVNCFYTDETGIGFYTGHTDNITNYNNFVYTTDSWKTFHTKEVENLPFQKDEKHGSNVVRIKDKLLFAVNSLDNAFNRIIFMDVDFNSDEIKSFNKFIAFHIVADNLENFYAIALSRDTSSPGGMNFVIQETLDSGKTFEPILTKEGYLYIQNIYEHNTDSVFISTPNRIYMYDRTRKVLDTIYKVEQTNNLYIAYLNNHFYIFGEKLFLVNSNPDDLTEWEPADWDYGIPSFYSIIHKGNVAIAELEDDKRPRNFYKMTIDKVFTSVEDADVEVKYYNRHFYASAPHPLPAIDYTKSRISWDMSFELEDAIKGVYDINGNNVEGKENIEIIHLGKASAELRWYCTTAPAGIYFIVVQHNGYTDTIPVVVVK